MSITATLARRLGVAAVALAALAAFVVVMLTLTVANAQAWVDPGTPVSTDDRLLTELLGAGTDASPEQAEALLDAADRVCEGITARVPVAHMTTQLMHDLGITGTEARDLVTAAGRIVC